MRLYAAAVASCEYVYLTVLQNHYRGCYAPVFALYCQIYHLFLGTLEHLQHLSKLEIYFNIQRVIFNLLSASFIAQSVRAFTHNIGKSFMVRISNLVVYILLNGILFLNPRLRSKRVELLLFVSAPVEQLFHHSYWDATATKAIIRLLCQDRSAFRLLSYLVDVLSSLICDSSSDIDKDLKDGQEAGHADELALQNLLFQERGVQAAYVAPMSYKVRRAVLESLKAGVSESRQLHPSPICSITLEYLLDEVGKIKEDVVAVVEGQPKQHAFLYRGKALYNWLKTLQVPTIPDNRCIVQPMNIYRLS